MNITDIIKNIDSLPPLSNAAHIVQSLYTGGIENLNIDRLVKVIESDSMLMANILMMINKPYYGFKHKITSISRAVSLFGATRIQMLVINYAVNEQVKADPSVYGFANAQFSDLCHLQSNLMFNWYSKIHLKNAHYLSNIAFMMETGKLILAKEVISSDYTGEFRKGFNECKNIEDYEIDLIDVTSYTLTALLFQHWNIEPHGVKILQELDADKIKLEQKYDKNIEYYAKVVNIIRVAINIKEILTPSSILNAALLVKKLGLDDEAFTEVANELLASYLDEL